MHIFGVSELTAALRGVLEGEFPFVWVQGQAVQISRPLSGHIYFTLRDGEAVLPVVWFRGRQGDVGHVDPVTGEVYEAAPTIDEGRETLVAGRITAYPPRGVYQLVAEVVQDAGVSHLTVALEALRMALAREGLFDRERKRTIPRNPRRVAVITAPQGAALQDFLRVAQTRGLGATVRLHPSPVQGPEAPGRIVQALEDVAAQGWGQVVVILRGGGALEDLWAFNTEPVVRAIAACSIPVVTGIGHEVDTTLADLAADVRAATPTHAAQLLWEEREVLAQGVDEAIQALARAARGSLARVHGRLAEVREKLAWLSPAARLGRLQHEIDTARRHMAAWGNEHVQRQSRTLGTFEGRLRTWAERQIRQTHEQLQTATHDLKRAGRALYQAKAHTLAVACARLQALNPRAPLERGFALVHRENGLVRSTAQVHPGMRLTVELMDGSFGVQVEEV